MSHTREKVVEAHFRFCSSGLLERTGKTQQKDVESKQPDAHGLEKSSEHSSKDCLIENC